MKSQEAPGRRRRRWQFTIRALLLAVLPVALILGLWQASRQWQAAHFIRVETSGGRVWSPQGQLDCDALVRLRCSRPFHCVIEHISRGHGPQEPGQAATTCVAQAIGSRAADRYGVDLRILCRDQTVTIYADAEACGDPLVRRNLRLDGLRASDLVVRGQGTSSVPLDTELRVLCLQANYDDPVADTSGSASDEFVIRGVAAD